MAEVNPPLYLSQDAAYTAADLGLPFRDIMGEGIVGSGDLAVTASTGLKSSVASGAAWIKGDDDANLQPTYRVYNDAPVLLQHAVADPTNARIDLVVAQVKDSAFSGVSKLWQLAIVEGTPAGSPAAPATPSDSIPLAQVTIPAGSGTLGTITDERTRARVGGGAAAVSGAKHYNKTTSKELTSGAGPLDLFNGEFTIAAGDMGPNSAIIIEASGDFLSNAAANELFGLDLRLGAVSLAAWAANAGTITTSQSATRREWTLRAIIQNLGALGSQEVTLEMMLLEVPTLAASTGSGGVADSNTVGGILHAVIENQTTVDTSTNQALVLNATLPGATATRAIKLKSARVTIES